MPESVLKIPPARSENGRGILADFWADQILLNVQGDRDSFKTDQVDIIISFQKTPTSRFGFLIPFYPF